MKRKHLNIIHNALKKCIYKNNYWCFWHTHLFK